MGLRSLLESISRRFHSDRHRNKQVGAKVKTRTLVIDSEAQKPKEITPIVPPGKCLDHFPDDIVYSVIEAMKDNDGIMSIRLLSLASRRLRTICLPYLFRIHCWRTARKELLPSQFWPYIRFFHLIGHSITSRGRGYDSLVEALPHMTSITIFKVSGPLDHREWETLLIGAARLPSLRSLEFVCSSWVYPSMYPSTFVSPPTRLVLHMHRFLLWPGAMVPSSHLFQCFTSTLEYLEICGDSMLLDLLKTLDWPVLRSLLICGHPFLEPTPLSDVLVTMPRLTKLDIQYQCRPEGSPLLLWPHTSANPPDMFLAELTSLSVTNPSIYDNVFKHLPPTLQSFSILAPSHGPLPLDRDELFHLLRGLRADMLTTLRLVVTGKLSASLFSFIVSTFPYLETLGIHWKPSSRDPLTETAEDISASLSKFTRLKFLELDVGFIADPHTSDHSNVTRAWVATIAHAVPSIERIAFAAPLTYYNHYWMTYDVVSRSKNGDGQDVCNLASDYVHLPRS